MAKKSCCFFVRLIGNLHQNNSYFGITNIDITTYEYIINMTSLLGLADIDQHDVIFWIYSSDIAKYPQ